MRRAWLVLLFGGTLAVWGQSSSSPANSSPPNSQAPDAAPSSADKPARKPNLDPPRSDRIDADAIPDEPGGSSSRDTQIDLSPPENDDRAHPKSPDALTGAEPGSGDVSEFHPWDPHKAAKEIEVGDFYFKRKNYIAAESRYREALFYKDNDALATFHLAICLEKMGRPEEAREVYGNYLKILPHGPQAEDARKAIDRLNNPAANAKSAK